jgi:hypothetical protein
MTGGTYSIFFRYRVIYAGGGEADFRHRACESIEYVEAG